MGKEERGKPQNDMVDMISGKNAVPAIKLARLEVSSVSVGESRLGLTQAEKQLTDIVDVGAAAMKRAEKTRRLDSYLRVLNSVWKFVNGTVQTYQPLSSRVDIEYYTPDSKTDKSV